jgi:hypothetical protein
VARSSSENQPKRRHMPRNRNRHVYLFVGVYEQRVATFGPQRKCSSPNNIRVIKIKGDEIDGACSTNVRYKIHTRF